MSVEVGQQAPDFTLVNQNGEAVTLSQFRGDKNVVLVFYPFAFSPTCTGELCAIRDQQQDIEGDDTVVLGISCDPKWALSVYSEQQGFSYDLLSDFWPHGGVAKQYGTFLEEKGFATRGTFVIDKTGTVRWAIVNSPADARSTDDYKRAIAELAA
jgi:mycoredoxin-dependent peroxiredoxin